MATFAVLRRFGLALPGAVEQAFMGDQRSLRVRGKIFAVWFTAPKFAATGPPSPRGLRRTASARSASEGRWKPEKTAILKLDRGHQHMLFEVRPEVFTPCKVGTGLWSYVDIATLGDKELQGLVIEAWSQVVPKKMREAFTSSAATSPQRRRRSKVAVRTRI